MKKTIPYTIATAVVAAMAAIIIIGCNGGDGGDNAGLNDFIGSFVNRGPGNPNGKFTVNVENGSSPGGNNYAEGETVVIITDSERDGQRFNEWSSTSAGINIADPGNPQTYFIMPPNAVTVTATFVPKTKFTVVYDGNENSGGTVPTDPIQHDSGAAVTALDPGDMDRSGHYFSGWSTERDGGRQIGAGEAFTITGPTTLYARWTPNTVTVYKVTVVNGSGGGDYAAGATVTISAGTAPSGQRFKNWTVTAGGASLNDADSSTTEFTMPERDVTVTANFQQAYKLNIVRSPIAGGTVSRDPDQSNYAPNAKVTVTATPASGYTFTGWSGASSATSPSVTITMDGDKTLTAKFAQNPTTPATYTLTVYRDPIAGGTTNPSGKRDNIAAGTPVSISASPASGYTFSYWAITSGSGNINNPNMASTTVTANENVTVTAYFKK